MPPAPRSSRISKRPRRDPGAGIGVDCTAKLLRSSTAKRLKHPLTRRRRLLELTAGRLVVVRMLEDFRELVKQPEIPVRGCCFQRGLDPMVARNESRIHAAHVRGALRGLLRLACQALAPTPQPVGDARGWLEELQ